MFTGLVREVGKVASFEGGRLVVEAALQAELGDSVAIDGVCLTVVENGGGRARVRRRPGDARPREAVRSAGQPGAGAAGRRAARRPLRPGPRRRSRPCRLGRARGRRRPRAGRASGRAAPLSRREGIGGARGRLADRRRRRRDRLRDRADPAHARGDDAVRARGRQPGQPRDRRARQVRRETLLPGTMPR